MKLMIVLLIGGLSFNLTACGNSTETVSTQDGVTKEQAAQVLNGYLQVKDALVQTDGTAANKAAAGLVTALGDAEDDILAKIKADAGKLAATEDVEEQRAAFNTLSDNVYELVKATGANKNTVYRQFCPMAFDNTGAFWLSEEEEIANPYFGDKMLKCGSVKERL